MKPFAAIVLIGILSLGVLLLDAQPAAAIRIEAESLQNAHNIGGAPIALVSCGTASNGHAIDGIDMTGEWVELDLFLIDGGCLYTAVRSAGLLGVVRDFRVEIIPDPPATSAGDDSLTTFPGTGIG